MNERIKELAIPAFCRTEYDNGTIHECYEFSTDELEKFAALIVGECVEALRLVPYSEDAVQFGEETVYQDAVKKHFGVE